jgi:alkanesulfonate monooxygenase SsuD/methylene tetrahydromethanopterin reductase-like flavin-dependent oxidoreductase (luciferase family)
MTAGLTQVTERFKFLVALRPGFTSPTLAAQMAATYQRISGGRLLLNIVTGGDDVEQRRFGDHLDKAGRYRRAAEFLHIVRELWDGRPVDFTGEFYDIQGGVIVPAPALMVDTLLTRTSGIRRRAQGGASGPKGLLARSTRAAIRQGARFAAAALIDRAVAEAQDLIGKRPFVVLTGGESAAVRPLLKSPAAGVPDLLLKGLAVLAHELPPPRARRR